MEARSNREIIRDLRNYLAGQVVGITRDEALLDEVLKCAFCRVALVREGASTDGLNGEQIAALYNATFADLKQRLYLLDLGPDLKLGPDHIATIDEVLRSTDVLDPARDVIGDLYEAFAGTSFRGQEGQFFTPKNAVQALVALVQPTASDSVIDPACGAGAFLLEAARFAALGEPSALPDLHGIDKDGYLVKLARIHVALQFEADAKVGCASSLSPLQTLERSIGFQPGGHSVILTNPPFGSKIVALNGDERRDFDLAHAWKKDKATGKYEKQAKLTANTPPQILFVERCLDLLGDGGRLGIVLPESTLSNSSHRYMVQYLLERATPRAVIGMPEALFKTSGKGGTHTKVCLAVFEKRPPEPSDQIFMAEAKWCGHDSRGLIIEKDDLPVIIDNFKKFERGGKLEQTPLGFTQRVENLRSFVLAPRYYDPEPQKLLRRLKPSHHLLRIGDLIEDGTLSIGTGHEVGKLACGTGDIPFVRTSDISNWEVKVDPKHGLSQAVYDELAGRQDVRENDILMVRDGTYLIGTCAMVTKHDVRIVYQSHLFKIRVGEHEIVDPHLLLASLSSTPVRRQIKANSFTMDIIDSLGDRIHDLVLPIPVKDDERVRISEMVRQVIDDRVEARELARAAAIEIAAPQ